MENELGNDTTLQDYLKQTEKEFIEYTKPPEYVSEGFVTEEDKGKTGEISYVGFANTKYGRKFRLVIKFEDGTEKSVIMSKTLARNFGEEMKRQGKVSFPSWIGTKVKIDTFVLLVRGKQVLKAVPVPIQ